MWLRRCIPWLIISFFGDSFAYKPVFLIHGINADKGSMLTLANIIQKYHTNTTVYISPLFEDEDSMFTKLEVQVATIGAELEKFSQLYPDGVHLIGHSQGGLTARAILEYYPNHRVQNFISLTAPQGGYYGVKLFKKYIPKIKWAPSIATLFLYNKFFQNHLSMANYWNDPHHQDWYRNKCKFLSSINNEIPQNVTNDYKSGITKLKQMVLFGGPNDEVIEPWQSSQFGFFDDHENVVMLQDRNIYKKDLLGLKTLDERKALQLISLNDVKHIDWIFNETLIYKYILPWLD